MNNLIRRQDAIDAVETIGFDFSNSDLSQVEREELCEAIAEVRETFVHRIFDVTPAQIWIPCSERLPEERDWYLGIFQESDTGWVNPIPFVCDYVGQETRATTKEYWILRGFTDEEPVNPYYFNLKCIAWMPLPEPYEV